MVKGSTRALLGSLVDYAGLFPPAKLPMDESVRNYASYRSSGHSWMLGRFICPVSRLEEFRRGATELLPSHADDGFWSMSAIIDGDLDENLDSIFAFNHEHERAENGLAQVETIELKADDARVIDEALDLIPEELVPFFEVPSSEDPRGFVAALAGNDACAKIRTGGVKPEMIPPAKDVARFMLACAAAEVPFKATAGLHHPVRAEYPLTYEPDAPRGVMHGFLNVFVASVLVRERAIDLDGCIEVLETTDPAAFAFEDDRLGWQKVLADREAAERIREGFAMSYGSCSFTEPVEDLQGLGLLD